MGKQQHGQKHHHPPHRGRCRALQVTNAWQGTVQGMLKAYQLAEAGGWINVLGSKTIQRLGHKREAAGHQSGGAARLAVHRDIF